MNLKIAPITPYTATHQNTFDYLIIKTNSEKIIINYKASWTSGPSGKSGDWIETLVFKIDRDKLVLLSKKTKNSS